eukprot:GEMP01029593.1.p1 GENE.GEMP01029593.1~~GEMP01029593.1.p1  ORF type:complete len:448 (+),score=118.89 GEMP01029593.1:79-1422(+)
MGSRSGPSRPTTLDALHEGTTSLDDFVDVWCYWDEPGDLAEKRLDLLNVLQNDLNDYIWQKDALVFEVRRDHLFAHIRVGESVIDEWFVVKLLLTATKQLSTMSCQVNDIDGEFLAIEAANHLPPWVTPDKAKNKFWIRGGCIHLLPKEPARVDLEEALKLLRTNDHTAKPAIQHDVLTRVKTVGPEFHRARCVLPAHIAHLVQAFPQLVSVACDYLPPPAWLDLRQCANAENVEPEMLERFHSSTASSLSTTKVATVRFTRAHFARIQHLRFRAPRDFTLKHWAKPEGHEDVSEDAVRLGSMVTLGLKCAFLLNPEVCAFSWPKMPWPSKVSEALNSNMTIPELRAQAYERLRDGFNRRYARIPAPETEEEVDSESWMEISRDALDAELDRRKKELDEFNVHTKDPSFEKDFSSQIEDMMQKLSTIDGVEADDPFFGEDGSVLTLN